MKKGLKKKLNLMVSDESNEPNPLEQSVYSKMYSAFSNLTLVKMMD